jgi:hypothetical protein
MKKTYLTIAIFVSNIVFSQITVKPVFEYYNQGQAFTSIAVDKDSLNPGVWAGTSKKGLFRKTSNKDSSGFSLLSLGTGAFELSTLNIQSIATDQSGNLWVGHNGLGALNAQYGGIEKVNISSSTHLFVMNDDCYSRGPRMRENDGYASRNANAITVDKNNTVWVAHGFTQQSNTIDVDPVTGEITGFIIVPGSLSFKKANQSIFTTKSRYSQNFTNPINPDNDFPYPPFTCDPVNSSSNTRNCRAISTDSTSVWMAVDRYTNAGNQIIAFDLDGNFKTRQPRTSMGFTQSNTIGSINGVCANDKLGVWVTTNLVDNGFSVYYKGVWINMNSGKFPNIVKAGMKFNNSAIWKNEYGNVFMGTTKGLIEYNGRGPADQESSYTLYNQEIHGLISDNILGGASELIVNDSEEELDYKLNQWIATDNGIIKANIGSVPTDDEFKTNLKGNKTSKSVNVLNENLKRVEAEMDRRKALGLGVDKTYHEYTIFTELCDMAKKYNITCTQAEIFKLMQQNPKFQVASPITMSQDISSASLVRTFSEQDLKDINKTINEQTNNILSHDYIYSNSSDSVKFKVLEYYANSNSPMGSIGILPELIQSLPGAISSNIYDKDKLNAQQTDENPKECMNDKEYRLYNSPPYIYGRASTFKNILFTSSCDYDLRSIKYDPVTVFVYDATFTIINYTMPGHALFPGKVTRSIVNEGNKIYVVTIGSGYHFCNDSYLGETSRRINLIEGPIIFKNVDINFKKEFILK